MLVMVLSDYNAIKSFDLEPLEFIENETLATVLNSKVRKVRSSLKTSIGFGNGK